MLYYWKAKESGMKHVSLKETSEQKNPTLGNSQELRHLLGNFEFIFITGNSILLLLLG